MAELSKWVRVYRKSSGKKVPYPVPRSHMKFNPDLRIVPSDPSRARRLGLADPEPPEYVQPDPDMGNPTETDPTSGSDPEREDEQA